MGTKFASVYNRFLGKITDDMYMELTPEDTVRDLQNLLVEAIPGFEFPRKSLDFITSISEVGDGYPVPSIEGTIFIDNSYFKSELSSEEINILANLMLAGWLQRQITSIEVTRMKYSGTDFKMTSQANHLSKLLTLAGDINRQDRHLQRLYKRRRTDKNGNIRSNWDVFRTTSNGYIIEEEKKEEENETIPSVVIYDGGSL